MSTRGPSLRVRDGFTLASFGGKTFRFGRDGGAARRRFAEFRLAWEEVDRQITPGLLRLYRELRDEPMDGAEEVLTVDELAEAYLDHLRDVQDAAWQSRNVGRWERALRPLRDRYGDLDAEEFGPRRLKELRQELLDSGQFCRRGVNERVVYVRALFEWATQDELISPSVVHGLKSVKGLDRGELGSREGEGEGTVPGWAVEATLPYLKPAYASAVRLLALTGARAKELLTLTPKGVDRDGAPWRADLKNHKTARFGKDRVLLFGPRARKILGPLLLRREDRPLFDFDTRRLSKAIAAAILAANAERDGEPEVPHWSARKLRHNVGTAVRERFGVEQSRVLLGHASISTNEIYSERDLGEAARIMEEIG